MRVTLIDGGRKIRLDQDVIVKTNFRHYVIPCGFTSDIVSVPRVFHGILPPVGARYSSAAIFHDFMYRLHEVRWMIKGSPSPLQRHSVTRKQADQLFKEVLQYNNVRSWRVFARYRAVRMFGKKSWRKNNARSE